MKRKDLANNIWEACNIMRRDGGTSGVLEYMEQLSWMIFLKVFEDVEKRFEAEAKFEEKEYQSIIDPEYRWSNWATKDWKGEKLIDFIDKKLFSYLQSLKGTPEKEKVATIFNEISGNRMKSAYNLKDVIELLDGIDYNEAEDSHIVSQVYEDLLLKLGKEHGIAGEFYTPRPIIRLMVKLVNPRIGETVFDPFCGSCGFLVESYKLMKGTRDLTVEDYKILQEETFLAQEKKPLPYLIGNMNCILHGLLTPGIFRKNTLGDNIRNIPESQRSEIIMTNPPFGGEENKQIQQNFPIRSQSTELLALQYVMKSLKRNGKCGIVVPEGILFRGNSFAKVKIQLLKDYNLHTILSLPSGVFANVTASGQGPKTNLLFFDRSGTTKEIWYYDFAGYSEDVLKKNYSKANPVVEEDLEDCWNKWKKREISKYSWTLPISELIKRDYDLTARNPNRNEKLEYKSPGELITSAIEKEKEILGILEEFYEILGERSGSTNRD